MSKNLTLFCFIDYKAFLKLFEYDLILNIDEFQNKDAIMILSNKKEIKNKRNLNDTLFTVKFDNIHKIPKKIIKDCWYQESLIDYAIEIKSEYLLYYSLTKSSNYDEEKFKRSLQKLKLEEKILLMKSWNSYYFKNMITLKNIKKLCFYIKKEKVKKEELEEFNIYNYWNFFYLPDENSYKYINKILNNDLDLFLTFFNFHPTFYKEVSKNFIKLINLFPSMVIHIEKNNIKKLKKIFDENKKELLHYCIHYSNVYFVLHELYGDLNYEYILDVFDNPSCNIPFNISKEEKIRALLFIIHEKMDKNSDFNVLIRNDFYRNIIKKLIEKEIC